MHCSTLDMTLPDWPLRDGTGIKAHGAALGAAREPPPSTRRKTSNSTASCWSVPSCTCTCTESRGSESEKDKAKGKRKGKGRGRGIRGRSKALLSASASVLASASASAPPAPPPARHSLDRWPSRGFTSSLGSSCFSQGLRATTEVIMGLPPSTALALTEEDYESLPPALRRKVSLAIVLAVT